MIPKALKQFDVVVLPFPYSDAVEKSKRRPAVIISKSARYHKETHKIIVAMITTARTPWPHDTPIQDIKKAGLNVPCVVRMKLFTLEQSHIIEHIGSLSARDRKTLAASIKSTLGT
jgi:mRNA interferase MazF